MQTINHIAMPSLAPALTATGRIWFPFARTSLSRDLAVTCMLMLLLLTPAEKLEAQYTYATNIDGTITIAAYTGSGTAIAIPSTIDGIEVTRIGDGAFIGNTNLSGVRIPDSVTSIGVQAFFACTSLVDVALSTNLSYLGYDAFGGCIALAAARIPNSVTNLIKTFSGCTELSSVSIGSGVSTIWLGSFFAFANCPSLTNLTVDPLNPAYSSRSGLLFNKSGDTLIFYPEGRLGPTILPRTVQTNGFVFDIAGSDDGLIVVEASANLIDGPWRAVQTNRLANGLTSFVDLQKTNQPARFYRIRSS